MIVLHPNASHLTPEVLLAQIAEDKPKAVLICVLDENEEALVTWSRMRTAELAFLSAVIQKRVMSELL